MISNIHILKKNFTVSSSETRSIEISLVLTGEALLGAKSGSLASVFFLVGNKLCVDGKLASATADIGRFLLDEHHKPAMCHFETIRELKTSLKR